jgi:hypothetical protein
VRNEEQQGSRWRSLGRAATPSIEIHCQRLAPVLVHHRFIPFSKRKRRHSMTVEKRSNLISASASRPPPLQLTKCSAENFPFRAPPTRPGTTTATFPVAVAPQGWATKIGGRCSLSGTGSGRCLGGRVRTRVFWV